MNLFVSELLYLWIVGALIRGFIFIESELYHIHVIFAKNITNLLQNTFEILPAEYV